MVRKNGCINGGFMGHTEAPQAMTEGGRGDNIRTHPEPFYGSIEEEEGRNWKT